MMKGEGNLPLEDAAQAFFEAGSKQDWAAAGVAFCDMQREAGDYEEPAEGEDKGGKGPPAALMIFGKSKKE